MSIEVKVPALPESVSEATVATWHKAAGDAVKRDETLVELETDKVMLEVPAPADGTLGEIKQAEGASVTADTVLGLIEEGAAAAAPEPAPAGKKAASENAAPAAEPEPAPEPEPAGSDAPQSPAVRKLLAEHNLDAAEIEGSGKGGRLTKADVEAHLEKAGKPEAAPAPAPEGAPAPAVGGAREEQHVPMTRIRARIAERLVEAQSTAAMLTTFNEVDLQAVSDLRKRYRERFEKQHGPIQDHGQEDPGKPLPYMGPQGQA